jgi:hypothetical protein
MTGSHTPLAPLDLVISDLVGLFSHLFITFFR